MTLKSSVGQFRMASNSIASASSLLRNLPHLIAALTEFPLNLCCRMRWILEGIKFLDDVQVNLFSQAAFWDRFNKSRRGHTQEILKTRALPNNLLSRIFFKLQRVVSSEMGYAQPNKTIEDGGITVDFWIIKVHTSNWNSLWIIKDLGIIEFLWIIKVHIFILNDLLDYHTLGDHQILLDKERQYFHLKILLDRII